MKKIGIIGSFALWALFAAPVFACEVETTADLSKESVDMICPRLCSDFGGWARRPRGEDLEKKPQFLKCECRKPAGFGPCAR